MTRIRTLAAVLLALAGCSEAADTAADDAVSAPAVEDSAVDSPLLTTYGLEGMSGKEIVDHLDRLGGTGRPADLMASVRATELLLTDGTEELAVALPADDFYLSFAPFLEATHECYYHSLTTCQGELVEEDLEVTFTTTDGEVLVEEMTTTYANDLAGYWLPRDVEGTLTVTYDGRSGEVAMATGADDPTCLTTLQLT